MLKSFLLLEPINGRYIDVSKNDPQRTLNFSTAAVCLKHSIVDNFNAVGLREVEALMADDASRRVSK